MQIIRSNRKFLIFVPVLSVFWLMRSQYFGERTFRNSFFYELSKLSQNAANKYLLRTDVVRIISWVDSVQFAGNRPFARNILWKNGLWFGHENAIFACNIHSRSLEFISEYKSFLFIQKMCIILYHAFFRLYDDPPIAKAYAEEEKGQTNSRCKRLHSNHQLELGYAWHRHADRAVVHVLRDLVQLEKRHDIC